MPRQRSQTDNAGVEAGRAGDPELCVLVVSPNARVRRRIAELMGVDGRRLISARTCGEAQAGVERERVDLAVIDHRVDGDGLELCAALTHCRVDLVGVVLADQPTMDDAVRAMRAGAADLIPTRTRREAMHERLEAAAAIAERRMRRSDRVERLKGLCRQLNDARQEVSGHVGGLCNDLVDAYRDLSRQMADVTAASELNSLLRQELEVESLLRTMLEFVLAKVGSTNAAIFLPSSSGDYSLGAYVNYDCPRDSAEILLDHLANTMAPKFERQTTVLKTESRPDLEHVMGEDAEWLEDSTAMVVACEHEAETLAVILLFRDERKAFTPADERLLGLGAELFAGQLARVIRIHHRHLPREDWGKFDTESDSDSDFEDGFGDIDLAA